MKNRILIALFILTSLPAFSQSVVIGRGIRRPNSDSTYNLNLNAQGYPILWPKTGPSIMMRVSPYQVNRLFPMLDSIRALSKPLNYTPPLATATTPGLVKGSENFTIDPDGTGRVTAPGSQTLADVLTNAGFVGSTTYIPRLRFDTKGRTIAKDSVPITPGGIGAATLPFAQTKADSLRTYTRIGTKADSLRAYNRIATKLDSAAAIARFNQRVLHVSDINALTATAGSSVGAVNVRDRDRGGVFFYQASGLAPDYGVVFPASAGGYWVRQYAGAANGLWWGMKGDATDASAPTNTSALQAAINYVSASANAATDGSSPVYRGRPATLYIPGGSYYLTAVSIKIPGTIHIFGDGGLSYGGTFLYQRSSNVNLLDITGSVDGSSAVQIEDIRMRGFGSGSPTASLIYAGTANSLHSLYFNRVWFQGWEKFALNINKSDDLQTTNCVFDGATNQAFALGNSGSINYVVSNAVFSGNTFYAIGGGLGYAVNVDGLLFTHNRAFKATASSPIPFGIDALSSSIQAKRVQIVDNSFSGVNAIYKTKWDNGLITGNVIDSCTSRVLEFGGGGIVNNITVTDNIITGTWSGTVSAGGGSVPDAPVYAYGTGLRNVTLKNKIIDASATSSTAIYVPDARSVNNTFENDINGFATPNSVANASSNVVNRFDYASVSSVTAVAATANSATAVNATQTGDIAARLLISQFNSFTATNQTALNGKEPGLGNPATSGYLLSSTTAGVRSWVAPASAGGGSPSGAAGGDLTSTYPSPTLSTTGTIARYIGGETANSKTTRVAGSANFQTQNLPSGPYSADNTVTGMPRTGQYWLNDIAHYENGAGGDGWRRVISGNMTAPGDLWVGGADNNNVWLGWAQLYTSTFPPSYTVLTNQPTLGTAAALNVPASGVAATNEVVKGSDTRLSGLLTLIPISANTTLSASDLTTGKVIYQVTATCTITLPTATAAGSNAVIQIMSAGVTATIAGGSGVTVGASPSGQTTITGQYKSAVFYYSTTTNPIVTYGQ